MFIVKIYRENSDRHLKLFHTSEEAENYVLRKLSQYKRHTAGRTLPAERQAEKQEGTALRKEKCS